jgi:hypothetical protein
VLPPLALTGLFFVVVALIADLDAPGLPRAPEAALFACGAGTLGLVFIGIHNAWDTVTYLAVNYGRAQDGETKQRRE